MAKLFSDKIEPSCQYCELSREENGHFICTRTGKEKNSGKCRRFVYYPFDRLPKQQPRLKEYSESDFNS